MILDTNVLIEYPYILNDSTDMFIPIVVLDELDRLKTDKLKGYKVRRVLKLLEHARNVKVITSPIQSLRVPMGWENSTDNLILAYAESYKMKLVTNDRVMKIKAELLGVECVTYEVKQYEGVTYVKDSNELFDTSKFVENQYIITNEGELVSRAGELRTLRLPPSNIVKGLNAKQRCALDLLNNRDIPIKIIVGRAGSGKTLLTVAMGTYLVTDRRAYEKLTLIRNPIGSGEEIGFLPGDFEEKTKEFYAPIVENVGEDTFNYLLDGGFIDKKIPYFSKGITIKKSFIVVDEAEDMDTKIMKLMGTRVGDGSCIVFTGDFAQAETKYNKNNGLLNIINTLKGHPLVGIVTLDDNVRSKTSKTFSDMF